MSWQPVCWCLCVVCVVCVSCWVMRVSGMRVSCRVGQSVSSQGVSMQVMSMCMCDGEQVDRELDRLWGSR